MSTARYALFVVAVGCSHPAARFTLQRAIDCLEEPRAVAIETLGKPDVALAGPNDFDEQLVYEREQVTIDVTRGRVFSVGTGATDKADRFGGAYDGDIFGIHHGDSLAKVQAAWGAGEPPGAQDPSHRTYRHKLKTATGRDVSADVFYKEARGVYHVNFHAW
jgi:hypothetical protein